jgi:hypothetical protein
MTVRVNKSSFNIREKLSELERPIGLKGSELMRAETAQEARDFVSAGRKNLVINGAMRVAQRGTSGTGSGYTSVDRFKLSTSSGDVTLSQGSLTSGSPYDKGFRNFLRVTNTSTTTATNGYRELDYSVEAQDLANSGWVISNSNSHATISFWVRSSVSQRFYMYIRCVDGTTKSYTFPFDTIANTWVKVEQTIPGDSTLTVNNDNGQGLLIRFVVHYGTTYTGSGATNNVWRVTGSDYTQDMSTSFALTAGATFDVTGLQLEAGKNATEFEHRSYGEELALCQRYYNRVGSGNLFHGRMNGTTIADYSYFYPVTMRIAPQGGSGFNTASAEYGAIGLTVTNVGVNDTGTHSATIRGYFSNSGTSGYGAYLKLTGTTYVEFNAEL